MARAHIAALLLALVTGTLFAARPVARWDVVPYQRVTGVFKAGVVAFHELGVKVHFTVDGRKKYIAKRATKNERTGVEEFIFPLDAAKYKSGPITLGAKVVSESGEECDLPEIILYADSKSNLGSRAEVWVDCAKGNDFATGAKECPVKTLSVAVKKAGDGGTVYLMKGRHSLNRIGVGKSRDYWTLITPAPGTDAKDVRVKGGRPVTDKLLLRNINLYADIGEGENAAVYVGEGKHPLYAWFDECRIRNAKGRTGGISTPFGNCLVAYVTGGATREVTHGPTCRLVRNHTIERIAGSAFSGGDVLIANCKVHDIDPEGTDVTAPVLYEGYGRSSEWVSDAILFNVEATECKSRGIVGSRLRNAAFVNVSFSTPAKDNRNLSRFSLGLENVLFRNVEIVNQDWMWVEKEYGLENPEPKDVILDGVKVGSYLGFDVSGLSGIKRK